MLIEPTTGAVILHGDTPGQPGYRRKCRCSICRAGHAEHNRAWRAAKRRRETDEALADAEPLVPLVPPAPPADLQSVPTIDFDATAGTLEAAFDLDLKEPDSRVAFARTLVGVARYNARVLDQVPLHGRMDLISPVQIRLLDVLQRIGLLGFAGFADGPSPAGGEQGAGDGDGVAAAAAAMLAQLAGLTQPGVQPDAPVDQ
ncbi:hypothetical protein [Cellulomonas timonensis]|uniref:hypothetical protein n=1 Tax=Cellulomonas timonensis TaxID=1689271 RepID=UPI00082AFF27|nr:hypothetical protein [Cellulomonas timonensis]